MRIILPLTNRAHHARMKLFIKELKKHFTVDIFTPKKECKKLDDYSLYSAKEFKRFINGKIYDLAIIRADRLEMLPIASLCAYKGIKIAHIEGGADSGAGVIDTKVRDAISQLADIHLVTDDKARKKVSQLVGTSDHVYNVGSLDVSFAHKTKKNGKPLSAYILFLHHSIPNEDSQLVYEAVKEMNYPIVGVKANNDYKKSLMHEEFSPEEFVSLMANASCMVGNSSALCKELSILGTPGVLVGSRQDGRIIGKNVMRVRHNKEEIKQAIDWQLRHGKYAPDTVYFQKQTEKKIVTILKQYARVHSL